MYNEWLNADERLTRLGKARDKIVGRVKGLESPSVQVSQSSEKYLVVRERFPSRTKRPSVRESDTDGTVRPLVKHRTTVLVIIAKKSRSRWKMCVQRGLKTNMFHLKMEKLWGGMYM